MPLRDYETQRLRLRLANPALAGATARFYHRNRDFFATLDPVRAPSFFTEEGQRTLLCDEAVQAVQGRAYRFYLSLREEPEEVVGLIALGSVVQGAFQSCFLSYKLDQGLLRRGYMSEALVQLVEIAFEELGLHRIEGNVMPRNTPSLGLLKKAGFQNEGISPKYLKINGVWEDHVHMVLLNEA